MYPGVGQMDGSTDVSAWRPLEHLHDVPRVARLQTPGSHLVDLVEAKQVARTVHAWYIHKKTAHLVETAGKSKNSKGPDPASDSVV